MLFVFVCVGCSRVCVYLVMLFLFPTMPHVPLYVNNEYHKHNKTKQNMYAVCCCVLLFVLVVFVLFVHGSVLVLCCFSCFQLCCMFRYRLITNIANITKHKTTTCMCLLLFVMFLLCCVLIVLCLACFAFLVSNYAACSSIG